MFRHPGRVAVAGLLLLPLPAASLLGPWLEDAAYRVGANFAPSSRDDGVSASATASSPDATEEARPGFGEGVLSFIDEPIGGSWMVPDVQGSPRAKSATRHRAAPLADLRITRERVLALVDSGVRPSGEPTAASHARPAGVRIDGVSNMGIGVQDGDILVAVERVPVTQPGEVVALVLAARTREASEVSGRLYRGARAYDLVVEMPYLLDSDRRAVKSCVASWCSKSDP